jgi:hypothetical protein
MEVGFKYKAKRLGFMGVYIKHCFIYLLAASMAFAFDSCKSKSPYAVSKKKPTEQTKETGRIIRKRNRAYKKDIRKKLKRKKKTGSYNSSL